MCKTILTAILVLTAAAPSLAQTNPPMPAGMPADYSGPPLPPPTPRSRGPQLDVSVKLAQIAVATCLANGYKVTTLVADSAGVPVVMLSGDGAFQGSQIVAQMKTATVIRYKEASGVIADRAKADPALAAEIKADPKIGMAMRGALPLTTSGTMIGAIAVSGAPGGERDEACAKAALDQVGAQLR